MTITEPSNNGGGICNPSFAVYIPEQALTAECGNATNGDRQYRLLFLFKSIVFYILYTNKLGFRLLT